MKKKCTRCGVEKDLEEYALDKGKKDGRKSRCKECVKELDREYRIRKAEKREAERRAVEEAREAERLLIEEERRKTIEHRRNYYARRRERMTEEEKEAEKEKRRQYYKANKEDLRS